MTKKVWAGAGIQLVLERQIPNKSRKEKAMGKRKKDGCDPSCNRQKNENGKKKRAVLLAGAGIMAAVLLTAGLVHGCREKTPTMQEVFEAYLDGEDNGLEMLSGMGETEKEKVIDTAIRMLEGLFGDGSSFDREAAVKALEQAILELNLGLSGEEIHQLAEALTDLYVNAYQEVYTSEQKTQTTVKHLESSMSVQMEENLSSVSEHLTQLDLQIQDNQNTLEQIFSQGESLGTSVEKLKEKTELIREQVSESMKEIGEGFAKIDQAVGQTQEKLEQYYAEHEETIRESSKELQIQISGVRDQLADAQETLSDTLEEMGKKGQLHQEELLKQFQELDIAVKKTQEQLIQIGESGQKALAELGTDLKGEMSDNKSELEGILKELDESLQGTAKENMEYIESRFSSMELLTKAALEELSENINLSAAGLEQRLEEIHVQISDAKGQINAALGTMDQKQEEACQELMRAIREATKKIDSELEVAYSQLESLITQLSADTEADHAETLKVLDGMKASLGTSMQQNLDQLNASFSSLNSALEVYFEKLQEVQGASQDAIGELGTDLKGNQQVILDSIAAHDTKMQEGQDGIKESITQHNSSMTAGLEGVNTAVGAYQTSMQEFLSQLKTEINDQLKSVFTFVSNGKQGLASALLTKGVEVNQDATFSQFREAILQIPQKLVIGVQEVPGEISYDYHYHTDAGGTHVGEVAHQDVEGGCYTKAVYHTHQNACYNWTHEHNSHCKSHPIWVDWAGGEPYWGVAYDCGDQPANKRGSLKCTLPTSEDGKPIYYELGCGLSDGQITGAHIVYPEAGKMDTSPRVMEVPEIGLDLIITPQPDTAPPPPVSEPETEEVPETEEGNAEIPTEAETEKEDTEESTQEAGTLPETEGDIKEPVETEEIQTVPPSEDSDAEETDSGQEGAGGESGNQEAAAAEAETKEE